MAAPTAPPKPAAPMTATLCTEGPADLLQLALDRAAQLGHLVVGEGAVGSPELEPQCQRLALLSHLLAAVEVEQLHVRQQLAPARTHGALHLRRAHVLA